MLSEEVPHNATTIVVADGGRGEKQGTGRKEEEEEEVFAHSKVLRSGSFW